MLHEVQISLLLLLQVSTVQLCSTDVRIMCVCTELGFFLRGTLYPDNSIVLLSDIGEGSNALYCLTDWEDCCSDEAGDRRRGLWRFPSGGSVGGDSGAVIYSRRRFSSISLNFRGGSTTGLYTCSIPDAGDVTRTLSINIENSKFVTSVCV